MTWTEEEKFSMWLGALLIEMRGWPETTAEGLAAFTNIMERTRVFVQSGVLTFADVEEKFRTCTRNEYYDVIEALERKAAMSS